MPFYQRLRLRQLSNLPIPHLDAAGAKVLVQQANRPEHIGVKVDFRVVGGSFPRIDQAKPRGLRAFGKTLNFMACKIF